MVRAGLVASFAALMALSACARPGEPPPPNVVLITIDTLRADRLSCYGYAKHETPRIDALAGAGALFETAFCDVTWTTPSMASVMTGVYATRHGMKSAPQRLDAAHRTLAEILQERGYTTAAIIASLPLDAMWGLDQGFGSYDDEFTTPMVLTEEAADPRRVESRFSTDVDAMKQLLIDKAQHDGRRTDPEVTAAALAWLGEAPPAPFFLWVHYFGPHAKPDHRLGQQAHVAHHRWSYDRDVRTTDAEVGRVLDRVTALGLDPRTLVVLHADHGESLGEHNVVGHGQNLFEPTLRIPLIIRFPGRVGAGLRVHGVARNVDLLPTVLEALALPVPPGLDGESLWPVIAADGGPSERRLPASRAMYAESHLTTMPRFARTVTLPDGTKRKLGSAARGLRTDRWKLVRTRPMPLVGAPPDDVPAARVAEARLATEMLFDLGADPGEQRDVSDAHPEVVAELGAVLDEHLAREGTGAPAASVTIDAETHDQLRALGYLAE